MPDTYKRIPGRLTTTPTIVYTAPSTVIIIDGRWINTQNAKRDVTVNLVVGAERYVLAAGENIAEFSGVQTDPGRRIVLEAGDQIEQFADAAGVDFLISLLELGD